MNEYQNEKMTWVEDEVEADDITMRTLPFINSVSANSGNCIGIPILVKTK